MPPIYLLTSPHGWDESGKPFSPRGVGTAYIYNHWPFDNQYILSSMYTAIVQDDNQTHRPFRLIIRSNQKKIKLWNDIALTGYGLVHNLHYRSNVPPPKIISPRFEFVAFDENSTSYMRLLYYSTGDIAIQQDSYHSPLPLYYPSQWVSQRKPENMRWYVIPAQHDEKKTKH